MNSCSSLVQSLTIIIVTTILMAIGTTMTKAIVKAFQTLEELQTVVKIILAPLYAISLAEQFGISTEICFGGCTGQFKLDVLMSFMPRSETSFDNDASLKRMTTFV